MTEKTTSRLKRPIHPMPDDVREALKERGLAEAYDARPPYQRNDYIGWIMRAQKEATRQKRLDQMLDELEKGDLYMKMAYRPKRKAKAAEAQVGGTGLAQDDVVEMALALPETSQSAHRGRADLRVCNKIFVTLPEDGASVNLKTTTDELETLVAIDPVAFRDVWGGKWVGVDLGRVDADQLRQLITDAWRLAAPKRLAVS